MTDLRKIAADDRFLRLASAFLYLEGAEDATEPGPLTAHEAWLLAHDPAKDREGGLLRADEGITKRTTPRLLADWTRLGLLRQTNEAYHLTGRGLTLLHTALTLRDLVDQVDDAGARWSNPNRASNARTMIAGGNQQAHDEAERAWRAAAAAAAPSDRRVTVVASGYPDPKVARTATARLLRDLKARDPELAKRLGGRAWDLVD